jgi:DNA-binding PadR family transcriptional regulator
MSPRQKDSNNLKLSLLGFFLEKPYHGYELYKHIKQASEFHKIWNIKQSLFYNYLETLYDEGLLSKEIFEGGQFPDRKVFAITDSGKEALQEWVNEPVLHGREMRLVFLAKLFFAMNLGSNLGVALIDAQTRECERWVANIQSERAENSSVYQELIYQYRIRQIGAMIDWLNFVKSEKEEVFKD